MESLPDKRANFSLVSASTVDFKRSFSEKYVRLPEVESGVSCISFELYQDNLASKAIAT